MKVTVKERTFDLECTCRMHIIYEEKRNATADPTDRSLTTMMYLLYACILGSAEKQKIKLQFSEDEFKNWLDDSGYLSIISEFSTWLNDQIAAQYDRLGKIETDEEEPKKVKD